MDLDWCIRCDKRTQGDDLYCSDTCRRDDYQATGPVGIEQDLVHELFDPVSSYMGADGLTSPSSSPGRLGHQPMSMLSSVQQHAMNGQAHGRTLTDIPLRLPTPVTMTRSVLSMQRRHPTPPVPLSLEQQLNSSNCSLSGLGGGGRAKNNNCHYRLDTQKYHHLLSPPLHLNARSTTDTLPTMDSPPYTSHNRIAGITSHGI